MFSSISSCGTLRFADLWCFISFHFGLLGLYFSFSASLGLEGGYPLALCVLLDIQGGYPFALCGFLTLQGGILHNFGPLTVGPPHKLPKTVRSLKKYTKNLSAPWPSQFSNFWACGR